MTVWFIQFPIKILQVEAKTERLFFGGGSGYMSSFLGGYFHALLSNGVNLRLADIVVGTSAGAALGSALLGHRVDLFSAELNLLANYPKVMAKFVSTKNFLPSQERVMKMGIDAKDGNPDTIQAIGHAAMAAKSISSEKFKMNMKILDLKPTMVLIKTVTYPLASSDWRSCHHSDPYMFALHQVKILCVGPRSL